MTILWNKVTWYSKLLAVIFFVLTFYIAFQLGEQKANISTLSDNIQTNGPTQNWKTFTDSVQGISFKYPESLRTTYMHPVQWPPKVLVSSKPFTCTYGGSDTSAVGLTNRQIINGHAYCVNIESEGAAGSTYDNVTYTAQIKKQTVIFKFTVRSSQCANYPDVQKTACEQERTNFKLEPLVDTMIQSTQLSS